MSLQKQEFYEGAALHILVRSGSLDGVRYLPPYFLTSSGRRILLKHCTNVRSPWSFTFSYSECIGLRNTKSQTIIGLVCGSDGVAGLFDSEFNLISVNPTGSVHVSCYRKHRQHYEVSGPDGSLEQKIAPSRWGRMFKEEESND